VWCVLWCVCVCAYTHKVHSIFLPLSVTVSRETDERQTISKTRDERRDRRETRQTRDETDETDERYAIWKWKYTISCDER
jgi:hypothetical protein